MPQQVKKVVRLFVASPGDVQSERDQLETVVKEINTTTGSDKEFVLELIRWESHAYPAVGRPQGVINEQIGAYDIFVGIMWKRFGSPTGVANSGTEEEFRRAFESWKMTGKVPYIMFYFCQAPTELPQSIQELDQLQKVITFREEMRGNALVWEYSDHTQFGDVIRPHLHNLLSKLFSPNQVDESEKTTLPPAKGSVSIVSRDGHGDYRSISEAIRNAQPDSRILVRPGLYEEGISIDKPLDIIGDGDMGEIVVDLAEPLILQTQRAKVQGLTLRGRISPRGSGDMSDSAVYIPQGLLELIACDVSHDQGTCACIGIEGSKSTVLIRWCRIHNGSGPGVWARSYCQGTIEDCDIFGHSQSGVHILSGSVITVRNCKVRNNKQDGVHAEEGGRGTVEDCDIFGNAKDGVRIGRGGNPTVRRCQIYSNKEDGIEALEGGKGTVESCNIFGNTLSGVRIRPLGAPTVRKCPIKQNGEYGVHISMGPLVDGGQLSGGSITDCDLRDNKSGTTGPSWQWIVNTVFSGNTE